MITDAIQTILEDLVNSFSPIVESDIIPNGIFAVHQEDIAETFRDKEGIYGFIYNVQVSIIGDSQETMDPIIEDIINEIEATTGEVNGTVIEESELNTSQGILWDDEKKKYYDKLNFLVQTKNR